MEDNECYVYIIECNNGNYYTGITNDLIRRWHEHYTGKGARYVRNNGFKKPIFVRKCNNKSTAMRLETQIKKMKRADKINMILTEDKKLLIKAKFLFKDKIKNIYK